MPSTYEKTGFLPFVQVKNIDDIKRMFADNLDACESLGEKENVYIVVTKKNDDGTYTINVGGMGAPAVEEVNVQGAFRKKLRIMKPFSPLSRRPQLAKSKRQFWQN
jgi:hypothetical protein